MKRPTFTDLTPEQQAIFGNGCGSRFFRVPSFVFTPSCRHHDFNYSRGCGANRWYENFYKAPYYYFKANIDFGVLMVGDCVKLWHYIIPPIYTIGVLLFSFPYFTVGRWRTTGEIIANDKK